MGDGSATGPFTVAVHCSMHKGGSHHQAGNQDTACAGHAVNDISAPEAHVALVTSRVKKAEAINLEGAHLLLQVLLRDTARTAGLGLLV
jgi:hypothetical protein